VNPARLIGGWLLLCSLSAGGAYFAMDEADRRFDLAKYDLRAKVGLSSTPSPAPQPGPQPVPPSGGGGSQPPSVAPPPQLPTQPAPQQPGPGSQGPVITPPQTPTPQPAPPRQTAPSKSPGGQPTGPTGPAGGNSPQPNPSRQNPPGGSPSAPVNPPGNQQPRGNPIPTPSQPAPNQPAPNQPAPNPPGRQPAVSTPDPRSTDDWRQLRAFYDQINPRATAVLSYLEQMKRQTQANRGVFRVDLDTAMIGLRDAMTSAKRSLDAGDTDSARSYLGTAYQQLQFLEQNRR
jgi:hypothetical protein